MVNLTEIDLKIKCGSSFFFPAFDQNGYSSIIFYQKIIVGRNWAWKVAGDRHPFTELNQLFLEAGHFVLQRPYCFLLALLEEKYKNTLLEAFYQVKARERSSEGSFVCPGTAIGGELWGVRCSGTGDGARGVAGGDGGKGRERELSLERHLWLTFVTSVGMLPTSSLSVCVCVCVFVCRRGCVLPCTFDQTFIIGPCSLLDFEPVRSSCQPTTLLLCFSYFV